MMGAERRSMVMTDEEKTLTAYHEAGHAIVGLNVPKHDPLHKVTIIPRGRAMGLTMSLPERDKYSVSITELKSRLAMTFGGRVAEELVFGPENVTSGASGDISMATNTARNMVTVWGMSEKSGAAALHGQRGGDFPRPFGDATQERLGRRRRASSTKKSVA